MVRMFGGCVHHQFLVIQNIIKKAMISTSRILQLVEFIKNVYRCSGGLVMVWWFGWGLSRLTSDVLLYKIEKKIFLDRGPTRYGLINRAYYPKNRYFLIFWLYHVILHILKPRKKHPEGTQLAKKKLPAMVLLFNIFFWITFWSSTLCMKYNRNIATLDRT